MRSARRCCSSCAAGFEAGFRMAAHFRGAGLLHWVVVSFLFYFILGYLNCDIVDGDISGLGCTAIDVFQF